MFTKFAAILVLLALTFASETYANSWRRCKAQSTVDANYDDQNYMAGTLLPQVTAVGTYKGLTYNAFFGIDNALNDGVQPHSKPNEIVSGGPIAQAQSGTPYIQATAGSTSFFDLKSFYFGCAQYSAAGAVGLPTSCVLTIKGFYQGVERTVQEFTFTPTGLTTSSQSKASPAQYSLCRSDFKGLDKVEFTIDKGSSVVALFDDLVYIPYTCSS